MAAILDFQNGGYYGVNYGNILACELPRLLILMSNYTLEHYSSMSFESFSQSVLQRQRSVHGKFFDLQEQC